MKLLQKTLLPLLLLSIVALVSCKKDKACEAPELSVNIVGTWDFKLSNGTVEFKADGTLVDPDDTLIGAEVNGTVYDQKTYVITGTTLTATAKPSMGSGQTSFDFDVTQNECDEIKIEVFGFTETMTRK